MGLVVLRHNRAGPVKDVGGVIEAVRPLVGDAAADDVDFQLLCQGGEDGLGPLPVPVGAGGQILGEEARVPGLGQDHHVRLVRIYSGADQRSGVGEIFLHRA